MKPLRLSPVPVSKRNEYMHLLLLADESEEVVKEYINEGDLYLIHAGEKPAGVILFISISKDIVELKNIALQPEFRGKGIGKEAIQAALPIYKEHGVKKVIVGTANSSIGNIAFYQKAGFRIHEIKRDFFAGYPSPIYEDGIRALDMIMFEKEIDEV